MIDRIGNRRPPKLYILEWMQAQPVPLDSKRLAERMERSEPTVSKLLSGKMKMTVEYLAEFAHALNIEPDQLFHDPKAPTRDELLRGYSNEELTSAIQLIEHTRAIASQRSSAVIGSFDGGDTDKRPKSAGGRGK